MHNLRESAECTLQPVALPGSLAGQGGLPGQECGKSSEQDGMIRVYIAIILLLLVLTVSQVCAQAHFGYEGTNL